MLSFRRPSNIAERRWYLSELLGLDTTRLFIARLINIRIPSNPIIAKENTDDAISVPLVEKSSYIIKWWLAYIKQVNCAPNHELQGPLLKHADRHIEEGVSIQAVEVGEFNSQKLQGPMDY
jgi:hypothetical protein